MNYERQEYIQYIPTENVDNEEVEEMGCSFGFSQEYNEVEDNTPVTEIKKGTNRYNNAFTILIPLFKEFF